MEKANFELSQGKQGFSSSPTFSFLEAVYKEASSEKPAISRWLFGSSNFFFAASSGTPLLERWQCSLKNFSVHT